MTKSSELADVLFNGQASIDRTITAFEHYPSLFFTFQSPLFKRWSRVFD